MDKQILNTFYLFAIIFLLLVGCSPSESDMEKYEARAGTLDLRDKSLEEIGPIHLDGEWLFYWQQFLDSSVIQEEISPSIVQVPDSWSNYRTIDDYVEQYGYATYQMNI